MRSSVEAEQSRVRDLSSAREDDVCVIRSTQHKTGDNIVWEGETPLIVDEELIELSEDGSVSSRF